MYFCYPADLSVPAASGEMLLLLREHSLLLLHQMLILPGMLLHLFRQFFL
jgi:hypothetical protein